MKREVENGMYIWLKTLALESECQVDLGIYGASVDTLTGSVNEPKMIFAVHAWGLVSHSSCAWRIFDQCNLVLGAISEGPVLIWQHGPLERYFAEQAGDPCTSKVYKLA